MLTFTRADQAGRTSPRNDEACSTPHAAGPKNHQTKQRNFTHDGCAAQLTSREKRFANAQAHAALRGITLHQVDGDFGWPMFVASIFALTRQFESLDEVESWLLGIEASHGEAVAA